MNLENIKIRYAEVGLPILLIGLTLYAIGQIIGYIIQTIYGVSHLVIPITIFLGMILIVIGAFSIVMLVRHI